MIDRLKSGDDVLMTIKEESVPGEELSVKVTRDDKILTFLIEPDISTTKDIFGKTISRPVVGIAPANELLSVSYGPAKAFYYGGRKLIQLTSMTYKMLWLLVTGGMPVKESLSGPIGIAFYIKQAAHSGIAHLLLIMAHISMALAVFNMLPFPVLDGGHIVFLFIEKIRRKPISVKIQESITNVAFFVLIAFALFVSFQDVMRFTPLGEKIAEMRGRRRWSQQENKTVGAGSKPARND